MVTAGTLPCVLNCWSIGLWTKIDRFLVAICPAVMSTFGAALFYEWFQSDRFIPFAGIHLSFNIMSREFTDAALARQSYSTFTPGIVGGLKIRLSKNISAVARARVHYLLYNVDETRSLGSADFGALLDYEFKD